MSSYDTAARREVFAKFLDDPLEVTCDDAGLGLALRRPATAGEVLCRCEAVEVHRHSERCEEVELLCASRHCFLPRPCYCAALSSLLGHNSQPLLCFSRPPEVFRRAPGMLQTSRGLEDEMALEILRHFELPAHLLPLYTQLARVWKYNAFDLGDGAFPGDGAMAIFQLPSLCNHSCRPALDYEITQEPLEMTLVARRGLDAGEALTISYIEENEAHRNSRLERRNTLAEGWLFFCRCEVCHDGHLACCCGRDLEVWISNTWGGPYEDTGEAPCCDECGEEDLVVSGPYFFHCSHCEADLCPNCAEKYAASKLNMPWEGATNALRAGTEAPKKTEKDAKFLNGESGDLAVRAWRY